MDRNWIAQLNRGERIFRIGELLSKGVSLLRAHAFEPGQTKEREETSVVLRPSIIPVPAAKDKSPLATTGAQDDTDIAITAYMARVGQASPRDLQQTFALSKATIFRRLRRLELTGTVARSGRTTARRYHLVSYNNAKQRSCTEIKAN